MPETILKLYRRALAADDPLACSVYWLEWQSQWNDLITRYESA